MWVRGHSRLLKLVPFESLGAVSYSSSVVTVAVSVAVCEIFSVKEWRDLENRVRVRSRSLEMAPFDRSHTSSYSPSIPYGEKTDNTLSRFHTIPERNGRTDRQTDRFAISISRVSMLTCDKKTVEKKKRKLHISNKRKKLVKLTKSGERLLILINLCVKRFSPTLHGELWAVP